MDVFLYIIEIEPLLEMCWLHLAESVSQVKVASLLTDRQHIELPV